MRKRVPAIDIAGHEGLSPSSRPSSPCVWLLLGRAIRPTATATRGAPIWCRMGAESSPRAVISGRRGVIHTNVLGRSDGGQATGTHRRASTRHPSKSPDSASTLTPDVEQNLGSSPWLYQIPRVVTARRLTAGDVKGGNLVVRIIGVLLSSCSTGNGNIAANWRKDSYANLLCQGQYGEALP